MGRSTVVGIESSDLNNPDWEIGVAPLSHTQDEVLDLRRLLGEFPRAHGWMRHTRAIRPWSASLSVLMDYMLFLLTADGVPSPARIVRIN